MGYCKQSPRKYPRTPHQRWYPLLQEFWWAVLLIVVGVVILMAVFIRCCAIHTPSSNPNMPKNLHFTETLRRPVRSLQQKVRTESLFCRRVNWAAFSALRSNSSLSLCSSFLRLQFPGYLQGVYVGSWVIQNNVDLSNKVKRKRSNLRMPCCAFSLLLYSTLKYEWCLKRRHLGQLSASFK